MCFTLPIPITHYPLHIIRIITFGKTHLKKWSEPLRKKKEKFYDLKEEFENINSQIKVAQ